MTYLGLLFYYLVLLLHTLTNTQRGFTLSFLDVGQGDAALIQYNNYDILVDAGPVFDIDHSLPHLPFTQACHLDLVIVTHPHLDHYGGLRRLARRCQIDQLIYNDVACDSKSCRGLRELFPENKFIIPHIGDELTYGDMRLKIVWTESDQYPNVDYSNPNNLSVVVLVDYKDFEALMLGDAEKEVLETMDLKEALKIIDGGLDVLKISHHGAKNGYSPELIQQLKPKNCVISVGAENEFGHPNPEVLESLTSLGCAILRTDREGDIEFGVK